MSSTQDHPDSLIAEYALGLLGAQDTEQAHALLADPQATAQALQWESRLLALADQLAPMAPSANLLLRIQTTLGHDTTVPLRPSATQPLPVKTATPEPSAAARMPEKPLAPNPAQPAQTTPRPAPVERKAASFWASLGLWRGATVTLAVALAMSALVPVFSNTAAPTDDMATATIPPAPVAPPRVAILQAPGQTSTPGWIVTFDASGDLLLNPKVAIEVSEDAVVYLWVRGDTEAPRLLAALNPNSPATVPGAALGSIKTGQIFEITQEVRREVPPQIPQGPILFIGRLVTLG